MLIFGGIHDVVRERRTILRINMNGVVQKMKEIKKMVDNSSVIESRSLNKIRQSHQEIYKSIKIKINKADVLKKKSKNIIVGYDRDFYEREFIIRDPEEKVARRDLSKLPLAMRHSLISLGVCKNMEEVQEILEDKIPKSLKRMIRQFKHVSHKVYYKKGRKPSIREGHTMNFIGNTLYIVGGMRHTLCLNDIYKIEAIELKDGPKNNSRKFNLS